MDSGHLHLQTPQTLGPGMKWEWAGQALLSYYPLPQVCVERSMLRSQQDLGFLEKGGAEEN